MSEPSSFPRTGQDDPEVPAGRIEKLSDGWALAFDRQFDYPEAHIWDVLTNPRKVGQWLGAVTPDWELGKEYTLDMAGGTASGTVLQLTPRNSLQITWDDDLGEESVLEWQVLESDGGALLQFRSRTDTADFLAEGSAGWQGIMTSFAAVAAGARPPAGDPRQWRALRDAYAAQFGVSPTMGYLETATDGSVLVFDRWYRAAAGEVSDAVARSAASLELGDTAEISISGDDGLGKLRLRQQITGRTPQETAAMMAVWHMALDSAALRLAGEDPHPNSHRLRALEALYRTGL